MSNQFSPAKKHYVYIIREKGLSNRQLICKIGLSNNVEQRLKTLQGANIRELQILETFHVGNYYGESKKIEEQIQSMFHKEKGEWFKFNPTDFKMKALPKIEAFVKGLNVEAPRVPIKAVANEKWTLAMYNEIKLQQAKYSFKKRQKTITVAEELHLEVIERGLDKQRNYERQEAKKQHEARVAKRKAYEAKQLLEVGVFK